MDPDPTGSGRATLDFSTGEGLMGTGLFTRGGPGAADTRGKSMVEKHLEKQRAAMEAERVALMAAAYPQVSKELVAAALAGVGWDLDAARKNLAGFIKARGVVEPDEPVPTAANVGGEGKRKKDKKKDKDKERGKERDKNSRRRGRSDSGASGDSSDDSEKKSRRSRKDRDKDERRSKKEKNEKKDKRAKTDRAGAPAAPAPAPPAGGIVRLGGGATSEYGKYGVIRETDMWSKMPEFIRWAEDVKTTRLDGLAKWEERDLFKDFMEDYNTATMPSEKYYNVAAWEAREKARVAAGGASGAPEPTSFDDESERRVELQVQRRTLAAEEALSLRRAMLLTGKAQEMRDQELLKQERDQAYRTGDVAKARELAKRLEPEAPEPAWKKP